MPAEMHALEMWNSCKEFSEMLESCFFSLSSSSSTWADICAGSLPAVSSSVTQSVTELLCGNNYLVISKNPERPCYDSALSKLYPENDTTLSSFLEAATSLGKKEKKQCLGMDCFIRAGYLKKSISFLS